METQYQYKAGDEVTWKNHDGHYVVKAHQYKTMPSLIKIVNVLTGKWVLADRKDIEPIKQEQTP